MSERGTAEVQRVADPTALTLKLLVDSMRESVARRGRFILVLAGGRTPLALYERLRRVEDLPWRATELFWGDERFVPSDHPASNARSVRETLIDHVDVPPQQVHPWPILGSPEESAAAYASELVAVTGEPPSFDFTLLGLGSDCHTASLFPRTGAHLESGLTLASRPHTVAEPRLSLTPEALSRSRIALFLVTGSEKRQALETLLAPTGDPDDCPARAVSASERLLLITDQLQ